MSAEIINREHPDIVTVSEKLKTEYLSFNKEGCIIGLSLSLIKNNGLKTGDGINFVKLNGQWFFYLKNDADAFKLTGAKFLQIRHTGLISMFFKDLSVRPPARFRVISSLRTYEENRLFKIDIFHPF